MNILTIGVSSDKTYPHKETQMATSFSKVLILLCVLLSGCSAANFGTSTKSIEIDRMFLSGSLPQNYHYYYNGVRSEPTAILGLPQHLKLNPSKFWVEIDIDERQLKEWRSFFSMSFMWADQRQQGSIRFKGIRLWDQQGNPAGILFSRYDWVVTEFPGNGVMIVHPPQPQPINKKSVGRS